MKVGIFILFIMIMITSGCYTSMPKRQYFDFNEIEHYYLSKTSEKNLKEIESKELHSKHEKLMLDLYFGKYDFHLSDSTKILNIINSINYSKKSIPVEKNQKLIKIFRDRQINESYDYMCFREYRDVLVFKYNDSIRGIAFICFKCSQNEIIGTNQSTLDFGQKGNYERLYEILYDKKYKDDGKK